MPGGMASSEDEEWKVLEAFLGMSESWLNLTGERTGGNIGMKLKSKSGWFEGGNGINLVGLDLLPAGLMETGIYKVPGQTFWTWTAIDDDNGK